MQRPHHARRSPLGSHARPRQLPGGVDHGGCLVLRDAQLRRRVGRTALPRHRDVVIEDGRLARLPGWEVCGFELLGHSSAVDDWHDERGSRPCTTQRSSSWPPGWPRAADPRDGVPTTSHAVRNRPHGTRPGPDPVRPLGASRAAHHDLLRQTLRDAVHEGMTASLTRNGLTADALDDAGRIVILQFWRNTGPVPDGPPTRLVRQRGPSVPGGDPGVRRRRLRRGGRRRLRGARRDGAGRAGPAPVVLVPGARRRRGRRVPHLRHRSRTGPGGRFSRPTPAFRDPAVPLGEPARSSIELRATCVFT